MMDTDWQLLWNNKLHTMYVALNDFVEQLAKSFEVLFVLDLFISVKVKIRVCLSSR